MNGPLIRTKYFGEMSYDGESVIDFPWGVPGFDERRMFVAIRLPRTDPLVFLQSLDDPELCFVAMPVLSVEPAYRLRLTEEDLQRLSLPASRQPRIGPEVHCLAILSIREDGSTANLLAPVVINLRSMKAVQAVAAGSTYSHRTPLAPREASLCS